MDNAMQSEGTEDSAPISPGAALDNDMNHEDGMGHDFDDGFDNAMPDPPDYDMDDNNPVNTTPLSNVRRKGSLWSMSL